MSSEIFGGTDLNRVKFDLSFIESINQYMQVPSRLKILEESTCVVDGAAKDEPPPSFQMHIPDRISLAGVEMMEVGLRPFQFLPLRRTPPAFSPASLGHLTYAPTSTESPFLKATAMTIPSTHRRPGRPAKDQIHSETHSPATRGAISRHDRQEMCSSPGRALACPAYVEEDGRIYSLSNVFRTLGFLVSLLSSRLQNSFHVPPRPSLPSTEEDGVCRPGTLARLPPLASTHPLSAPDVDPPHTLDRPVEDVGLLEIIAMRKLLIKISGRLQSLEEERAGCHQKELLIYSALFAACLINSLLCLRK